MSENALIGATKISKTLSKISEIFAMSFFRNLNTAAFSKRILGQTDATVKLSKKGYDN